jgi:hypothetical protein
MKFIVNNNQLDSQPEQFLRQAGYVFKPSRHTGQDTFIKRLGRDQFPRFHIYINRMGQNTVFNVHLDQKKPSYQGTNAHAGEYDSELVEKEVARIKGFLNPLVTAKEEKTEKENKKSILGKLLNK